MALSDCFCSDVSGNSHLSPQIGPQTVACWLAHIPPSAYQCRKAVAHQFVVPTATRLHRDDDKSALSHAERQKREAEAMADLLSVERDESVLVWRAQAERLPVEHRADCDVCSHCLACGWSRLRARTCHRGQARCMSSGSEAHDEHRDARRLSISGDMGRGMVVRARGLVFVEHWPRSRAPALSRHAPSRNILLERCVRAGVLAGVVLVQSSFKGHRNSNDGVGSDLNVRLCCKLQPQVNFTTYIAPQRPRGCRRACRCRRQRTGSRHWRRS